MYRSHSLAPMDTLWQLQQIIGWSVVRIGHLSVRGYNMLREKSQIPNTPHVPSNLRSVMPLIG